MMNSDRFAPQPRRAETAGGVRHPAAVFVDETGRRRRYFGRIATGAAILVACYLAAGASALFGAPSMERPPRLPRPAAAATLPAVPLPAPSLDERASWPTLQQNPTRLFPHRHGRPLPR